MRNVEEDINNSKRNKQEMNKKINATVFKNMVIAILIIVYFVFIDLGYANIEHNVFITDLKVFSISGLCVAITLFEKGYKKDNEGIFLSGIEVFALSFITLVMPYTLFEGSYIVHYLAGSLAFLYFVIYYVLKSIWQTKNIRRDFEKSDIREIIKK